MSSSSVLMSLTTGMAAGVLGTGSWASRCSEPLAEIVWWVIELSFSRGVVWGWALWSWEV